MSDDLQIEKMLIASRRIEIGTFFELFLSRQCQQFIHVDDLARGFEEAKENEPELIVMDSSIADLCQCYEFSFALKRYKRTTHIPIILIVDRQKEDQDLSGFEELAAEVISMPFSNKETLHSIQRCLSPSGETTSCEGQQRLSTS